MSPKIHMALVDDEPDVEKIYRTFLRKEIANDILKLLFFTEGESVLEYLKTDGHECQILILVSDINMPGMSGLTLVELVHNEYPHIDLYLSSAYDYSNSKEEMEKSNVRGYLEKPVDFARVKQIIKEKESEIDESAVA
jgi:DNA-binding NtrC family response regulator